MIQSRKMFKYTAVLLFTVSVSVVSVELWKRLIPGRDCSDEQRLHHVQLVYETKGSKSGACGGTLIHKQWVLTAGHCYKGTAGILKVIVGVHPTNSKVNKALTIPYENIKKYNETLSDGDIMLLKLPEGVENIKPAKLPDVPCTHPPAGDKLQGDSGGGLLLTGETDVVFGVLIGGRRGGCGGQIVFTDVCKYRVWIKDLLD